MIVLGSSLYLKQSRSLLIYLKLIFTESNETFLVKVEWYADCIQYFKNEKLSNDIVKYDDF